jgi:Fe-S-cluster containining protein
MVARYKAANSLLRTVAEVYEWIDSQVRSHNDLAGHCRACGKCCDFAGFDHRLFVTPPEMIYLAANVGAENLRPMAGSQCPYQADGKCTIYEHRFAGCRIFCCGSSADFQSALSELAVSRLRALCERLNIPYRYTDLPTALNSLADA